jgi:hypothetical protein
MECLSDLRLLCNNPITGCVSAASAQAMLSRIGVCAISKSAAMMAMQLTNVRASNAIRYAKMDGLIVILDLRSEQYHIMDDRATSIWQSILAANGDVDGGAEYYLAGCGDPGPAAREQYANFVSRCIEMGFLEDARTADRAVPKRGVRSVRRMLGLQAWWSLLRTGYLLRKNGFGRTYQAYELSYGARQSALPQAEARRFLEPALAAFLRAENFIWFGKSPDDCLPRSLSLFSFLRSVGIEANHRIGGRRVPTLTMHAWVEFAGVALLEDEQELKNDTVVASLPTPV